MNKPKNVVLFTKAQYLGRTAENRPYSFRATVRGMSFYFKSWGPYKKKLKLGTGVEYKLWLAKSPERDIFTIKNVFKVDEKARSVCSLEVSDVNLIRGKIKDNIPAMYEITVMVPSEDDIVEITLPAYAWEEDIKAVDGKVWCVPNEVQQFNDDGTSKLNEHGFPVTTQEIWLLPSNKEIIEEEEGEELVVDE